MSAVARLSLELRAGQVKLAGLADRIRRKLHRSSYWRALATEYPLNGVTRAELATLIEQELQRGHRASGAVPLPGVEIRDGRCFYGGHALSSVSPEIESQYRVLCGGEVPSDLDSLLKAGLAVQLRATPSELTESAVIVSPHRDDGSLSLGGLMVARAREEAHMVCNVFTVSSWLGKDFSAAPLRQVSALRAAEERLSLQVLGAMGVGLGLWEADIRNYHRRSTENYSEPEDYVFDGDPNLRSLGERDSVRLGLRQLMDTLGPRRIYFPLGLGSHIDHIFLRDVGKDQAASLRGAPPHCEVYFYEDLPYASYEHVDVLHAASAEEMGDVALVPEFVDITDHFEAKLQAIAAHRSQFHRSENETRLRDYAATLAAEAGLPTGCLAERVWRVQA